MNQQGPLPLSHTFLPRRTTPSTVTPTPTSRSTTVNGHDSRDQTMADSLRSKLPVESDGQSLLTLVDEQSSETDTAAVRFPGFGDLQHGNDSPYNPAATLHSKRSSIESAPSPFPTAVSAVTDSFGATLETVITLLLKLDSMESAGERVRAMDTIVAGVVREQRVRYELQLEDALSNIMGCLSDTQSSDVRASTYRLLRHLIVDQHDVNLLHSRHISLFLIRSLCRNEKSELEKEHALRFVRLLLSLPDAPHAVPSSVIRGIVALAESQDEKLRLASLETLGELLIRDTRLLVVSDGLRVVLQALSDGPHDFSPLLALGFLWVVDRPDTRQYMRPGVDIEIVLAGLTETHVKGSSHDERVKASAKIVANLLKSWPGLMYLCLNGREALTSLVNSLKTPSHAIREALLDIFFSIFRIPLVAPASTHHGVNGHSKKNSKSTPTPASVTFAARNTPYSGPNLIDQYLAILLLVFLDAGLIEALISVASGSLDAATAKKVSVLISEILQIATRVLPLSYVTRVQALPKLFSLAASFNTSDARLAASSTLSSVDAFNREKGRLQPATGKDGARDRANSIDDPLKRGQRQVESTKARIGMQIDDAHFRNLLLETQVLSTKDPTRWGLDTLVELLEGPLLNPRRLDEAMRASKFMRRLLSFFHPFGYRYGEIGRNKETERYTQLGCLIINTLLANPDGVRYLAEDKLLPQIADCLAQLDPLGGPAASELLLSKHRMEKTLASGYFEMLGTLTKSKDGVKLLEQFKVFTAFYRISELKSRDDIIKAIISNIDYSRDGHTRVFLSKALTSSYKHVRIFATEQLAKLTRETLESEEWQIRLLLTQLYDPAPEVCELAVRVLEEACQTLETLEILVQMRPSLDHLGDMGAGLLIRFLSTSIGARYLHETDFIDRELEDWYHERNFTYMIQTEILLASAFDVGHPNSATEKTLFDGTPPPHFYGELVKTPEGCDILAESGHFSRFADYIQQHGLEDYDSDVIARLKSVLWAVGHVGASPGGLPFLENEFIVQSIIEIAEDSPVYSLRGTAYFVLGLISSTLEGVDILEELGWETVCTPLGGSTGVCVPVNVSNFIDTPLWDPPATEIPASALIAPPSNHLEREALAAFANLSNHILATKASKSLARLKNRHREVFSSTPLFYRALEMLSNYHYRLTVRRYMIELFDISLSDKVAQEIMLAGEELRARTMDIGGDRLAWDLPTSTQSMLVEGVDGDFTDDESSQEEGTTIPLQVLQPMLTIRGFLIS